ncbi:hypothetical protein DFH09DRAFT_1159971 [Mycena vulgaris]|nr:hypothetical protein DFH09DRAFT_1159971 [Mycena vulgaris]
MTPGCSISRLPVELITEIFIHCLPDSEKEVDEGLMVHLFSASQSHPPPSLVLSRICSSWREISLSTPALWSTLYLNWNMTPLTVFDDSGTRLAEVIEWWFERARLLPLSVVIRGTSWRNKSKHLINCTNAILRRYAARLRSVQLVSDAKILPGIVTEGPFPILEEVHLGFSGFPHRNIMELFLDAPQLRLVHLDEYAVDSFFLLPWRHLTEFTGEISSMVIFRLAPALVDATISITTEEPRFEHESKLVIDHPRLRSLTFFSGERGRYSASVKALGFLTLPALKDLDMCSMDCNTAETYAILSSFLSRSSPPLRYLSITMSDMLPDWENHLASLGTLESLRLKHG